MSSRAVRRTAVILAAGVSMALAVTTASATTEHHARAAATTGGPTYAASFSPNKPGTSTAFKFTVVAPQQPSSVTVALPPKTLLNLKSAPVCGAPPSCDPSTQVGNGTASVNYTNASGTTYVIPLTFQVFNHKGGLVILLNVPNATPVVILPTWSGTSLTIPYPSGTYQGLPIQITKVSLSFFKLGAGKGAFMRTPATCTKSGWKSTAALTSSTGAVTHLKATAKCQVPKPKHKKG